MYDLVIIGGSAASSAAAVYAARRKLNFSMVCMEFGGEVATSGEIENWPSVIHTTGIELADAFLKHVKANNIEPETGVKIEKIVKRPDPDGTFELMGNKTGKPVRYEAKSVIVATGVHPRHLEVPGEKEFYGKGVTYCTTCDGPLYKEKKVVTIGGGNSALESALMLASIASHVTVLNLNEAFRGEQVLIDNLLQQKNVDILYQAQTLRIEGSTAVERVVYTDRKTEEEKSVDTQGVFVHIGLIPNSDLVSEEVKKNQFGEIEVNMQCETNISGLFAAGDVTNVPYKQIAVACGQGVIAALSAIDYLNKLSAK